MGAYLCHFATYVRNLNSVAIYGLYVVLFLHISTGALR
ncbi:hypothetical protein BH09BAC4_BH09BAC4_03660 [soil metagenome]